MGNLHDNSLEEIWNGERFRNIRLRHDRFDFSKLNAAGIECIIGASRIGLETLNISLSLV